jgi:hypothetical protein
VKLTELARDVERFTSHLGSGWFDVFLLANKMRLVLHDVVQHWHWLLTRELLHQIVRSGGVICSKKLGLTATRDTSIDNLMPSFLTTASLG